MILALIAATALSIRVDWLRGSVAMTSAEVYGNGTGIWNDQAAFVLTKDELATMREAVKGFAAMPEQFGKKVGSLKIRGKVRVDGKTVVQLKDGPQSEELATLAGAVLATAETAARERGVTARDLPDALEKLASGAIPIEALHITAQRRDEAGWLLQLRGREGTVRPFSKGGYSDARPLVVSEKDLRELAVLLRDLSPLRQSYAPAYTELRVEILNRSLDLQARPEIQGERLKAFDQVIERLQLMVSEKPAASRPSRR